MSNRFVKVYSFPTQQRDILGWQHIIDEENELINNTMQFHTPYENPLPETRSTIDEFMEKVRQSTVYMYHTLEKLRSVLQRNNMELTHSMSSDTADSYRDVFSVNLAIVHGWKKWLAKAEGKSYNIDLYFFVLTDEMETYYGSTWVFVNPDYSYIGMYGIKVFSREALGLRLKGSLIDIITKKGLSDYGHVSRQLVSKIEDFGRQLGLTEIVAVNPLPGMKPILEHYGFDEYEDDDDESPVRKFMEPISVSYSFFARDIV